MTNRAKRIRPATRSALDRHNAAGGTPRTVTPKQGPIVLWCAKCRHTFAGGKKALGSHCRTPGCKGRLTWTRDGDT